MMITFLVGSWCMYIYYYMLILLHPFSCPSFHLLALKVFYDLPLAILFCLISRFCHTIKLSLKTEQFAVSRIVCVTLSLCFSSYSVYLDCPCDSANLSLCSKAQPRLSFPGSASWLLDDSFLCSYRLSISFIGLTTSQSKHWLPYLVNLDSMVWG